MSELTHNVFIIFTGFQYQIILSIGLIFSKERHEFLFGESWTLPHWQENIS